jgi:hypothetical protein
MPFDRILILLLYFLYYSSIVANSYVLLYNTENSRSVQYYDCVYYTKPQIGGDIRGVKYCRQLNKTQSLQRDFNQSCHNDGELWLFEELSVLNISASDVLQWSSSIEQADRYSKYLSNSSLDVGDRYICNCTKLVSFGKFCEYEFYHDSTSFDETITSLFKPLENVQTYFDSIFVGSQLHSNRPCYTTWTCDSGLMCLDWRHICDGKNDCFTNSSFRFCF